MIVGGRPSSWIVVGFSLVSSFAWADGILIDHKDVGCAVAGKFPQLFARFDPADNVARARVAFRASNGTVWYSVPMTRDGYNFIGILPQPEKSLRTFDYYIAVADRSFNESRTREYSPEVVSGPAACHGDKMLASALVKVKSVLVNPPEGLVNAAKVPLGFSNNGVIAGASSASGTSSAAAGSSTGSSSAATAGAGAAGAGGGAAAAGAVAGGAAAGGLSTAAITGIAVGGAGAVAGGVAVAKHKSMPPTTLPPSVTGTWVGTASFTDSGNLPADNCSGESDSFTLTLSQSGSNVTGTRLFTVVTPGTCADGSSSAPAGATSGARPISGTVNSPDITLSGVCGSSGTVTFVGKISGNSIDGTSVCNAPFAEDPAFKITGPFHVTKQ